MRRITAFFILVLLAGLTGCKTNPSTGRSQFLIVSANETRQMGIEAKPQLIEEYGGEYPSQPLREYVAQVGSVLVTHVEPEYADVEWEFILLDSEVINAFALPGGKVFITVGLLSHFRNEAQVAGVLGHEIGHVSAQHVDERLSQTMAAQLGVGILGVATDSELVTVGAGLLVSGTLLKFNRDQELEADRQGLKYMSRAYYDPIGMRQVLEVLRDASEDGRALEFLSTHPHPERRLYQVEEMLAEGYAFTQNNPAYGVFESRFDRDAVPFLPVEVSRVMPSGRAVQYCGLCRQHATGP